MNWAELTMDTLGSLLWIIFFVVVIVVLFSCANKIARIMFFTFQNRKFQMVKLSIKLIILVNFIKMELSSHILLKNILLKFKLLKTLQNLITSIYLKK
jgi:hypothetical protein